MVCRRYSTLHTPRPTLNWCRGRGPTHRPLITRNLQYFKRDAISSDLEGYVETNFLYCSLVFSRLQFTLQATSLGHLPRQQSNIITCDCITRLDTLHFHLKVFISIFIFPFETKDYITTTLDEVARTNNNNCDMQQKRNLRCATAGVARTRRARWDLKSCLKGHGVGLEDMPLDASFSALKRQIR